MLGTTVPVGIIDSRMTATFRSFAGAADLTADTLAEPELRSLPRPSALLTPLKVAPPKSAEAATSLGLHTVGDLLEHLPRDTREARSIADLVTGEPATVVVEVRAISSRPVRRRGMRPLVEATVADESGPMKVQFFNQPWLVGKYPPGTRLLIHGTYKGKQPLRRHLARPDRPRPRPSRPARSPTTASTSGISSTQILELVRSHRADIGNVVEPLPARLRVDERLADRPAALDGAALPRRRGRRERRSPAAGLRGAAPAPAAGAAPRARAAASPPTRRRSTDRSS